MKEIAEPLYSEIQDSPLGRLVIVTSKKGVREIRWGKIAKTFCKRAGSAMSRKTKKQLTEYFAQKRKKFDLPLDPRGTDFQLKAWHALRRIPYGKTASYQDQAKQMGDKKLARAVGSANSRNPIPILVPCHRVIGKNGDLTGFAGGLNVKRFLLDLENPKRNCNKMD